MSASIEIPYAIGTVLWWPGNGYQEKTIVCPECVGAKVVTLTLGNGESYGVACACCGVGFDPPTGHVTIRYTEHAPQRFECATVEAAGNEGFRYRDTLGHSALVSDLFVDRAQCLAVCAERNERHALYLFEGQIRVRTDDARRKLAWSVHYWRRQRAEHVKDIEYIDARLRAIGLRATNGGGDGSQAGGAT